jgi:colicin import membrane protein
MAAVPATPKPRQPGRIRAVILALLVHAAFFALIVFGVSWQSQPTAPLQAELWDRIPPSTAAPPPKPEVAPEPPKPEPPKPEPAKAEPKPEPPAPDPAIAEKKEREKKERLRKEQEARERLEREKRDKLEKQKQEEERKKREAEEADRKKKLEEQRARDAQAKAQTEAKKAAEAAAAARESEIDRYRGRIRDKIRGKANVPDTVTGRPEVQVRITILPGGDVLEIKVTRSSGNRVYDEAIERAIRSAQPLPVPTEPELFARFRDLTLNIQHER